MQVNKPLITVILMCYSQEKFVAEAVEGVLSQTYAPLEIIIFDDCSPDKTAEIIERTTAKHPRKSDVRFMRNSKNISGYAVAKMGIEMAKGKYIFISCGDDVMLPSMIEEMASVLIDDDVSLVTANARYIDAELRPLN